MATKSKRRWYQFSLKALLVLMFVASLPLGAHVAWRQYLVAKRLAEIEKSFQWLESLDYPDMPTSQPVLVTTTSGFNDRDTPITNKLGLAFLLSENADSFTILTPSLERKTFERKKNLGEGYSVESSFERTGFQTAAATSLERRASGLYHHPYENHGDGLRAGCQLLVMAWACARHGYGESAIKLYDAAEQAEKWRDSLEAKDKQDLATRSFLDRAATDFADGETRNAVQNCGSEKPRSELLRKFRWINEHFPNSKYAEDVKEKVAILEHMVAEDVAHEQRRAKGPSFEQLSKHEQIAEIIFQLRDRSINLYACYAGHDPSSPYERLKPYGYEAIPQLAAALSDKSLTRTLDRASGTDSSIGYRVCTVGEFVDGLLTGVAGRGFDPGEPIWGHSERIAAMQDTTRIKAIQEAALDWHQQLVTKGERACIIETIQAGGPHCASLASHLAQKEPDVACEALLVAARQADDEDQFAFSNVFRWIQSDKPVPYLLDQLGHAKAVNRLEAAEVLNERGRSEGVAAMIEQWQRSKSVAELRSVGSFLVGSRHPAALRAVAKRFSEQSIEQRSGTMYQAGIDANPKRETSDEARTAMIELLLIAIKDTELRPEPGGAWAGPSIDGLRICDMAGYHLNQLEPTKFAFNIEAPLNQRDRARRQILLSVRNSQEPAAEAVGNQGN